MKSNIKNILLVSIITSLALTTLLFLLVVNNKTKIVEFDVFDTWQRIFSMIFGYTKLKNLKYILVLSPSRIEPLVALGIRQQGFIDRKCPHINCYVTYNKYYLKDYTTFDAIVFPGSELSQSKLPIRRSPEQRYVFGTMESSHYFPICSNQFDGFFNWTWTHRLDSEVVWGYVTIRDENSTVVGPNKHMHWIKPEDMKPVSDKFKQQLKTKTRAAAWFASNCHTASRREKVVKNLQKELEKYNLTVDVYGKCGNLICSKSFEEKCNNLIKMNYYFYLSFENSFSEDYVTEKLLNAVQNDAVPVVYGAANYSRYLPDGAYLNAMETTPEELAAQMNHLIQNVDEYYDYFRWKNHYTYYRKGKNVETDPVCHFCEILNNKTMTDETKIYHDFRKWWNVPNKCKK